MHIIVPTLVTSVVLLLVRAVLTITFISEARFKFKDLKGFSKSDGIPLPFAGFIATAELAAAVSMASGVLSQWAGIGLVLLMVGTICLHLFRWHSPYWANKRGWEYDLLMLVLAAVIVCFGPGVFALFAW